MCLAKTTCRIDIENHQDTASHKPHPGAFVVPLEQDATEDAAHVDLSWRSRVVEFLRCFACEEP
jgi:hypothetical protein